MEGINAEEEGRVVVQDLIEEGAALFDFEVVRTVKGSLVDRASEIGLFRLSFSGRQENIEGNHIVDSEFLGVYSLFKSLFVEDDLVAVDKMFF